MKEYLLTNFVMLFEIVGILLIIRLSVNVSKRTVTATVLSFSFILLSSILYSVERWLGQQETLSVWRVISSYAVYAMQPIIIFLTMQIAAPIKKKWIWLLAPELIGVILYVTSPWTKLVCWYNEWNDYQAGPLYRLPYMVFAFYIVVFLVQTIRYFRKYHVQEKICLVYVVSVSMGGIVTMIVPTPMSVTARAMPNANSLPSMRAYLNPRLKVCVRRKEGFQPLCLSHGVSLAGSLGKRIASLMLPKSSILTSSLSMPIPHPPCGGIPYLNASR